MGRRLPTERRRPQSHLVLFTVVGNSLEMSTEEFQRFEVMIRQLVDLRERLDAEFRDEL